MKPAERIRAFRHALEEGTAERMVYGERGVGLFADSVAGIFDLNYVRVNGPAPVAELVAECGRMMERFFHRKIVVERGGRALASGFRSRGWDVTPHLIMALGRPPDRTADARAVREVALEEIIESRLEVTVAEPTGDAALARLLDEGKRRIMAAVPTRFFAAFADGRVASYCEVRSDGRVAQIEDVNTLPGFRRRGLARAVVQHAMSLAAQSNDIVFLEALAEDWPKDLYTKLGFDVVDERIIFLLPPSPLTRLRLRTPRLELRLATIAELRELTRVAQAGIHDPAFMPFETAWTDRFDEASMLDWHTSALGDWTPEAWRLELVAFVGGRPVGVQGVTASRFGETRRAATGSWLGAAWQGHGFGTEMRAAVLTLLFDGLGAREARSGALQGNAASLAVSRKLGYRETGMSTVSPRGAPVPHHDLVLTPEEFRRPRRPVVLEGLEPLLPLFGAAVDGAHGLS